MDQANKPAPPKSTPLLEFAQPLQLRRALVWALDSRLFAEFRPHGNTSWKFPDFVLPTLFWVWSDRRTLTAAFDQASRLCRSLVGTAVFKSYRGFAGALTTWTPELVPLLWACLQKRMAAIAGTHWRIGPWLPLAVDGSRTTTPRTRKNERAFCPQRFGGGHTAKTRKRWKNKKRRGKKLARPVHPQIWLTLLWHMGLKMPWSWKCGPSYSSERHHFAALLETQEFPEKTPFCGDAGFVGYDLWRAMADRGHHFLIRVGSNVRLPRRLGAVKRRGEAARRPGALLAERGGGEKRTADGVAAAGVSDGPVRDLRGDQRALGAGLDGRPSAAALPGPMGGGSAVPISEANLRTEQIVESDSGTGLRGIGVVADRAVADPTADGVGANPEGDRSGEEQRECGRADRSGRDGSGPTDGSEDRLARRRERRVQTARPEKGAVSTPVEGQTVGGPAENSQRQRRAESQV